MSHIGIYNWDGGDFGVALTTTAISAVGREDCAAVSLEGQPEAWVVDGITKVLAEGVEAKDPSRRPARTQANLELVLHGFTAPDKDGNRRRISNSDSLALNAPDDEVSAAWGRLAKQVGERLKALRNAPQPKTRQRPDTTLISDTEALFYALRDGNDAGRIGDTDSPQAMRSALEDVYKFGETISDEDINKAYRDVRHTVWSHAFGLELPCLVFLQHGKIVASADEDEEADDETAIYEIEAKLSEALGHPVSLVLVFEDEGTRASDYQSVRMPGGPWAPGDEAIVERLGDKGSFFRAVPVARAAAA